MQEILRHEKKFLLNAAEFAQKKHELSLLLHEDPHNGPDGYLVRSLYFDTEYDGDFFDKTYGIEVRRKLRLRIYEPNSEFALLEIKQKQGELQKKRSLRISRENAKRLIGCDYRSLLNYSDPFALECYALMNTRCYRPRTVIQYRRKAFISGENSTRICFDSCIGAMSAGSDLFSPNLILLPVIDHSLVVLEVKYKDILFSYINELLCNLNKSEMSVSKYCISRQIEYHSSL